MAKILITAFDELWLKGKNQHLYRKNLLKHFDKILKSYGHSQYVIRNESERYVISTEDEEFSEDTIVHLKNIPGLSKLTLGHKVESDESLLGLKNSLLNTLNEYFLQNPHHKKGSLSFKVIAKRIDRNFSVGSMVIEREIGHFLLEHCPQLKVDVHHPQMKLDIRVLVGKIYYSFISYPGIGGLPVGSSGHGLTMISGGFDSPVASFLMAKRGLRQTFIFFHAAPYIGNEVVEKIKSIVSLLAKYQRQSHLYVVPFGNIQKVISQFCHEQHMMEYQTLFFRREMVRLSEMLLPKIKAECIVVGDSLGQVSSQTLSNMHIMNQSVACPILRPLIGLNKMEILKIAEAIKTHDLSMIPFDDACSLFAPKNPVIQPDESIIKDFDQNVLRAELFQKERLLALETMEAYAISVRGELQLTDAVR